MGNAEAKELVYTTHGHELREGGMLLGEGCRAEGNEEKKWDDCNSIINKIYYKKKFNLVGDIVE